MSPDLAAEAIARFTRPGDVVLDPMCGIGTTLVEAVHAGRDGVGVECEPRWVAVTRANIELAAAQGGTGNAVVVTGDARHLDDLLSPPSAASPVSRARPAGHRDRAEMAARVDLARLRGRVRLMLTSPPYGASTHGRVEVPGRESDQPLVSHLFQHYTDGPGRQRRPRSRRGPTSHRDPVNLAQVGPAELQAGLSEIFAASLPLLAPDAVVVVTARPWRREGLLIDLPGLVARAGEDAGLYLADRHVALLAAQGSAQEGGRLIPRHSFLQLLQSRWARERGDHWALISHEDVLILRPLSATGAQDGRHHKPPEATADAQGTGR
jgi:predicted RNA methylase